MESGVELASTRPSSRFERFCRPPGKAKRLGRKVTLRPDWEQIKTYTMLLLLRIKFSDENLATKLLETGEQKLIEGNSWGDCFWGVCDGVGENHLGKLLMQVREELKSKLDAEFISLK